jgi:hypothetical protein
LQGFLERPRLRPDRFRTFFTGRRKVRDHGQCWRTRARRIKAAELLGWFLDRDDSLLYGRPMTLGYTEGSTELKLKLNESRSTSLYGTIIVSDACCLCRQCFVFFAVSGNMVKESKGHIFRYLIGTKRGQDG